MTTGVILVAYNAADIIIDCLESLWASEGADLRIVVVDNASSDTTSSTIRAWTRGDIKLKPAEETRPFNPVNHASLPLIEDITKIGTLRKGEIGLIRSDHNRGFAGGVNLGLTALLANTEIEYFWILNPDCMAEPNTANRLEARARVAGKFGVIGGRVLYTQPKNMIQSDGGRVNMWTGICIPHNMTLASDNTLAPAENSLDYIAGAHMFVSRDFISRAGMMPEDYFLYYEEIDWCRRRGDLSLLFEVNAAVHHHGGHTIGSAKMGKGPSPLSAYFLNRARRKFIWKYNPIALPLVTLYSTARALRSLIRGHTKAGIGALRGIWGLSPTSEMMSKIGIESLSQQRSKY